MIPSRNPPFNYDVQFEHILPRDIVWFANIAEMTKDGQDVDHSTTKENIMAIKKSHGCTAKNWTQEEEAKSHTWMTETQQDAWESGAWRKIQCDPNDEDENEDLQIRNWKKIYTSLYPDVTIFPEPQLTAMRRVDKKLTESSSLQHIALVQVGYSENTEASSLKRKAGSEPGISSPSEPEQKPRDGQLQEQKLKQTQDQDINSDLESDGTIHLPIMPSHAIYDGIGNPSMLQSMVIDDLAEAPEYDLEENVFSGSSVFFGHPDLLQGSADDNFNDSAFLSPFSMDASPRQSAKRDSELNNAIWNENTRGPGSITLSHTSGSLDLYSHTLHSSTFSQLENASNQDWGSELDISDEEYIQSTAHGKAE
ncbi:hypothetical protein BX600DRAFT_512695 [Xylariales sp. PMI_506]|nr:hypothetical protein BX600DRAFT_512695 [Xylariales sp. PMI_506]